MRRALAAWLSLRVAFVVAVASFAMGRKCVAEPLPGRDVEAFAEFLGRPAALEVDSSSLGWEPSDGTLADTFFGRRLLFLGRTGPDGAADVFRARVRVSRDGHPLEVLAIKNLTETPSGSEKKLQVVGQSAAFAAFSGDLAQGITVLELASATRPDFPGNALNRVLLRLRALQESDSVFGIGRTHLRFEPTEVVQFALGRSELKLRRQGADTVVYRLSTGELVPAEQGVQVTRQPLGSNHWLHTLADLLREEVGSEPVFRLASYAFGLSDALREAQSEWLGPEPQASGVTLHQPAAQGAAFSQSWPPAVIEPLAAPAEPNEGVWMLAALPWDSEVEVVPDGAASSSDSAKSMFATTFFRPDPERPYVKLWLVAMDMRRLELRMEAGYEDPKPKTGLPGRGALPSDPEVLSRVRATFNGGFKSLHGDYGMVVERRVLVPPVPGAATIVLTEDGKSGFGVWPESTEVPREIVSLRQNLEPLLVAGKPNAGARSTWGEHAISDGVLTERSALCLAENGHVYYGLANGVSALDLARALQHAGCRFAMHLDMNPHHCGFFFHDVPAGEIEQIQGLPAFPGIDVTPKRFAQWSSKDFFYVVARDSAADSDGALPSPGKQPEPRWLPALTAARRDLGALDIRLFRVAAGRVRYSVLGGSEEPILEGRPAPLRELGAEDEALFAVNLGHTTSRIRYGLAFRAEASQPLRRVYATLLLDGDTVEIVPSGQEVSLSSDQIAVQLPQLMLGSRLMERAGERGSLRTRGALCRLPDGSLLIATARHDSSDVLALTLKEEGCTDALELDRGSQHDVFIHRAGTNEPPRDRYPTTVLIGLPQEMRPKTFGW